MMPEYYSGYKITYNARKAIYSARNGRKTFSANANINILKRGIDAWNRNVELSGIIASTPEGRSNNPNVVRTYEKDNRSGY